MRLLASALRPSRRRSASVSEQVRAAAFIEADRAAGALGAQP